MTLCGLPLILRSESAIAVFCLCLWRFPDLLARNPSLSANPLKHINLGAWLPTVATRIPASSSVPVLGSEGENMTVSLWIRETVAASAASSNPTRKRFTPMAFRARIISLGKSKPKREQDSRTFYHTHNHAFRHDCLIEAFQIWPTERDQND